MIPKHGMSFLLLLCHYALLVFVVLFFFLSIVAYLCFGQIAVSLVSVARDQLQVELVFRDSFAFVY